MAVVIGTTAGDERVLLARDGYVHNEPAWLWSAGWLVVGFGTDDAEYWQTQIVIALKHVRLDAAERPYKHVDDPVTFHKMIPRGSEFNADGSARKPTDT